MRVFLATLGSILVSSVFGFASTKLPVNPLAGIKDVAMGNRMYRFEQPGEHPNGPGGMLQDGTIQSGMLKEEMLQQGTLKEGALPGGEHRVECSVSSPYHLQELSARTLRFGFKAHSMYWISGICQTGDALLNEFTAFLSVQKIVHERLRMGIMIVFQNEFSSVCSSKSWIYGAVHGQLTLSPKTAIGMLILNPNGSKITSKSSAYSTSQGIYTAIQHRFSTAFSCSAEVGYQTKSATHFSVGCDYHMVEQLHLQSGLSLFPIRPGWGLSVTKGRWECQYAGNWHAVLGISSAVELSYSW